MNFGIIAAGEGSRLCSEGISLPKPLVNIDGLPMIERLLRIFQEAGAKRIVVCINDFMPEVRDFLEKFTPANGIELILRVKSTPSSMHTFSEIASDLRGHGRFILTTVDTIFRPEDFRKYVDAWESAPQDVDALMAVTPFVEDEKPLWVEADELTMQIKGFLDSRSSKSEFVSGGIYGMSDRAVSVLDHCLRNNVSRMRNFQRALIQNGLNVMAFPMDKILDVDHASDIEAANAFLRSEK